MKKKLTLVALSVIATACASSPQKPTEQLTQFKSNYEIVDMDSVNAKSCPGLDQIAQEKKTQKLTQMAHACVKGNEWNKVEKLGQKMLNLEPQSPWGAYFLSLQALTQNNFTRALWMNELANKKATNLGLITYQKGQILWKMNDPEGAVLEIKKAINLDPKLYEAQLFLGDIYLRDDMPDKAKAYYQAVLKAEQNNHKANIGMAEVNLMLNDHKQAETFLKLVLNKDSKNLVARFKLAYLYEKKLANLELAMDEYKSLNRNFKPNEILQITGLSIDAKLKELEKQIAQKEIQNRKVSSMDKNANQGVAK